MTEALNLAAILVEDDPEAAGDFLATLPPPDGLAFLRGLPGDALPPLLGHLPEPLVRALLTSMEPEDSAQILDDIPYPFKTQVARFLPAAYLARLLGHLPRRDARQIRRDLAYAEDSVGARMETATTVLEDDLSIGDVLALLRRRRRAPDSTLIVIGRNKAYRGVIEGALLLGASERQPIHRYLDRRTRPLAAESKISEISGHEGWERYRILPVVGRNGALLGMLRHHHVADALADDRVVETPADMGGTIGLLLEAAVVCAGGFAGMFDPSRQDGLEEPES